MGKYHDNITGEPNKYLCEMAADACLRGQAVVFNVYFRAYDEGPLIASSYNPASTLHVVGNFFAKESGASDLEDFAHLIKFVGN